MNQADLMTLNAGQWLFLGLVAMTAVIVGAVLVRSLRRPVAMVGLDRRLLNIAIYRERMAEAEAGSNVDEVRQRLLEDAEELTEAPARLTGLRWPAVLIIGLTVLTAAGVIYVQASDSWRLIGASPASPPVDYLLRQAQRRTETEPNDAGAWLVLARIHRQLDHQRDAANAYARANRLRSDDADALVEEGEVLANLAGGNVMGKPIANFEAALKLNPQHPRALFATGLAAYVQGDKAMALTRWQALAALPLPDNLQTILRQKISELGGQWPAALAPARLRLRVALAPELGTPPAGSVVFVYAQALNGPRQPLAVLRSELGSFPMEVTLTDADSMAGGPGLSSQSAWRVVARISPQGNAIPQPGDWIGERQLTRVEADKAVIPLTINRVQ